MKQDIADAIAELRVLELRYSGYTRTVEPHAYGRDKSGDEILRCYQTGGGSQSGERVGWKLLKVADVYAIHTLKAVFGQRPEYKRNDKAMDYIFCQL
ncbi:hypothetical protein [Polaromonas sp.]|uniref:hypothetical protein n=1 Tax=Polaromonas sp. TaxID=1869339 RepID=UPI0037528498